ncbi:MAG: VOC family protein [Gammaproteobacteria bacterium]|nr:VOC family protein [Gammaproteobacteria bacterium]
MTAQTTVHSINLPVSMAGIAYITISVADMDVALDFWVDRMGFELSRRRSGSDELMAALWGIEAHDVIDQALLTSPGASAGRVHLMQFAHPGEAVRHEAAPTDIGPKNLDINCTDMHRHVADLKSAGYSFRSEVGEYTLEGLHTREVQMPCHDDINMVFIEVLSEAEAFQTDFSPRGFAGVTSFVVVVPDTLPESQFYQQLFSLDELLHHRVSGPEIEAVVGLPKGAALELRMLGKTIEPFGRMELVSYEGIQGVNRFNRTVPFATGVISCAFIVPLLAKTVAGLEVLALPVADAGRFNTVLGEADVVRTTSPAGMKIDLLQLV